MLIFVSFEEEGDIPDQYVEGLGWISRNGKNFLPAIVRLEEILSGMRDENR